MADKGTDPEDEAREVIDTQLKEAGWKDLEEHGGDTGFEREYSTSSGPVDYALLVSGKPVAVVEAKEAQKDAYAALTQAKRYAQDIGTGENYAGRYGVPFVFTANSDEVWFQDLRQEAPLERKLRNFHRPEGFEQFLNTDYKAAKEWLEDTPIRDSDSDLWDNQFEAIQNIEEAIHQNKRRMLVQMATGTGKTRMACAQTYRLLKSGYVNSVLFLVDRNSLGNQAESAFKNYDVGPAMKLSDIYIIEQVEDGVYPENADIVIATLQGMYSLLENHDELVIPQDAFDFIISDESHRSIYGDWRVVLNHFDALQLGLTATPATHTLSYFNENWVYQYGYWQAVDDGHVVPYETYRIQTGITMDGLYYEDEEYNPEDLENKITVPSTNRLIAEEFRKQSGEDEKTLVFAKNDRHATELEKIFREVYSDKDDRYVKKITYTTDDPDGWIKRFRNQKYPKIAVTVDMVSTGVDVKPIENIIFIRPTRSAVLYNQMIGRGTRTCDEIGKEKFTIYDCIGIVDYFSETPPFNTYRPDGTVDEEKSGKKKRDDDDDDEIVVADDVQDHLEFSGYMFETEDGQELRPDDYVTHFERYVRQNRSEIEAIKIIMESPEALKRKHLRELNRKLQDEPEKFSEEKLQKAYGQEMTDIIGFITHALGDDEFPTTEDRVEKAFDAWIQDKDFTEEEREWLNMIQRHFVQEKVIKKEDFNRIPFSRRGGWRSAAKAFGGEEELKDVIHELNEEVILA
ncbi:DEAD/DEAH box helicase family protein [Halomicroarcula sp. F13]|uniref:DEAD/DEAH box helicase family protein n=1 Tax=Haloarcula rubra TaxID=2487747 RepID=A0AAW4PY20_9EURY|nr:type I restriction-modification enzyme R subunit C-terminal domain-containing protein [Halomicroarcula rubra]MBX0325182.1 DEAD/DEAH box helicase family protein [Halomicroarcula rubra]